MLTLIAFNEAYYKPLETHAFQYDAVQPKAKVSVFTGNQGKIAQFWAKVTDIPKARFLSPQDEDGTQV